MKPPASVGGMLPIPLLAFWAPVALRGRSRETTSPFWFNCNLADYADVVPEHYRKVTFRKIHVFSASLYLRSLKAAEIDILMPRAEARLLQLRQLLS